MNAYGVEDDEGFMERVTGVFIGEWKGDGQVYAVLHTEAGKEFLCRYHKQGDWQMVSYKDEKGDEYELDEPTEAANPLVVAWTIASHAVNDDLDDIVI